MLFPLIIFFLIGCTEDDTSPLPSGVRQIIFDQTEYIDSLKFYYIDSDTNAIEFNPDGIIDTSRYLSWLSHQGTRPYYDSNFKQALEGLKLTLLNDTVAEVYYPQSFGAPDTTITTRYRIDDHVWIEEEDFDGSLQWRPIMGIDTISQDPMIGNIFFLRFGDDFETPGWDVFYDETFRDLEQYMDYQIGRNAELFSPYLPGDTVACNFFRTDYRFEE